MTVVAGERWGDYVLEECLASGGMAEVFRARHVGAASFSREVCIKRMLPHLSRNEDFIGLFLDEAHTGSKLRHQNIVTIEYLGEHAGQYFLAMEFVNGVNLYQLEKRVRGAREVFPADAAAFVAVAVLKALKAAHEACDPDDGRPLRVVHRDVSPHNVLVSYAGAVKLTDFGIARAARQARVTAGDVVRGKFGYMPLEQSSPGGKVDARTDLFALGVTLFELLAGHRPFGADNPEATAESVFTAQTLDDRVPLGSLRPDAPPALCAAIDRMLSPKPAGRPGSADEVLKLISGLPEVVAGEQSLTALLARLYPGRASVAAIQRASVPVPPQPAASESERVITRPLRAKRRLAPIPGGDAVEPGGASVVSAPREPDTVPSARPRLALVREPDATTSVPEGVSATVPRAAPVRPNAGRRIAAAAAVVATATLAAGVLLLPGLRKNPAPPPPLAAPPVTTSAASASAAPVPVVPSAHADETPVANAPAPAGAPMPAAHAANASTSAPTHRIAHAAPVVTAPAAPAPAAAAPATPPPAPATPPPPPAPAAPAPAAPAPAAPPAEPATGMLHVATQSWGTITIDGRAYGRAPVHARVPAGRHTVRIEGGVEGNRSVTVPANGSASVLFEAAE